MHAKRAVLLHHSHTHFLLPTLLLLLQALPRRPLAQEQAAPWACKPCLLVQCRPLRGP